MRLNDEDPKGQEAKTRLLRLRNRPRIPSAQRGEQTIALGA
jgi:hypothetical protein